MRDEFEVLAAAPEELPELGELLRNPQIEPGTKRDALDAALGEADESGRNFIRLVAERAGSTSSSRSTRSGCGCSRPRSGS